ncbi:hypothetical protein O181_108749, partial [Austropuccinia psidii MF-1]|nr:hypothetical protein [Austropuccinia psidii MF-1]
MLVRCPSLPTMRPEEFPPKMPLPTMMKVFSSGNGHQDHKQADRNNSRPLSPSLPVLICPPPLLGHHPMVTPLLDRREVIIWPMKDGNGKSTFEHGPIFTHGIQKSKTKPTKSPRQDTPVPHMPRKQAPRQPTSGPGGMQWSEDLSCKPSQHNEPPILGLSPSSEPPEDIPTCEPEPEVALTQSKEDPF